MAARQEHLDQQLMAAIHKNDPASVKALLNQGADPNAQEGLELRRSFYQWLLQKLHPTTSPASDTPTALMLAMSNLAPRESGVTEIPSDRSVSEQNTAAIIKALLNKGADVNVPDKEGVTAWMQMFLASDFAYNPLEHEYNPPEHEYPDLVQAMLDHGADPNAQYDHGTHPNALYFQDRTPLMLTTRVENMQALLSKGADVNVQTARGVTPLMLAAFNGSPSARLQNLLGQGARIDLKDKDGWTALVWAARAGNKAAVQFLLDRGARTDVRSRQGATLIELTRVTHNPNRSTIIRLLQQHGARK